MIRCTVMDAAINLFGPRPPELWSASETAVGRGFAGFPVDNIGVQYGLNALNRTYQDVARMVDAESERKRKASEVFRVFEPVPQILKNVRLNDIARAAATLESASVRQAIEAGESALNGKGRLLIRNICMVFDRYLTLARADTTQPLRYSKELTQQNVLRLDDSHALNIRVDYRRTLGPVDLVGFLDVINVYAGPSGGSREFDPRRGVIVGPRGADVREPFPIHLLQIRHHLGVGSGEVPAFARMTVGRRTMAREGGCHCGAVRLLLEIAPASVTEASEACDVVGAGVGQHGGAFATSGKWCTAVWHRQLIAEGMQTSVGASLLAIA